MSLDAQLTRLTGLMDELSMLIVSSGGRFQLESNTQTHRHCLFVELQSGEFSRTFVFSSRHDILILVGSSEFQYLVAQFEDSEYLINIQPRDAKE